MKRLGETFEIKGSLLKIIGKVKDKHKPLKYIFECSKCSLDEELFPYGTIKTVYANVARKGQMPCACSGGYRYSEDQNIIRVGRYCTNRGYKFLGWYGDYNKDKSYLKLYNPRTCNTWVTTTMNNLFKGYGDPVEARQNITEASTKPDEEHINAFFSTGVYNENSTFQRLDGRSWRFTCGNCENAYVRCLSGFKSGKDPCGCSGKGSGYNKTKPANLYLVRWYGYGNSYLKVGITNQDVTDRVTQQYRKARLDYEIIHTFYNESGQSVWDCEKLIKQSVQTSVCPKELLPDGYTETTNDTPEVLQNMLDIIKENL